MALSIAHESGVTSVSAATWPRVGEAALVIAAIVLILPWFDRIAANLEGRDARFATAPVELRSLPPPVLPSLCVAYGGLAQLSVRERLCPRLAAVAATVELQQLPQSLLDARTRVRHAFLAPQKQAEVRLAELRLQQREGLADSSALRHAIDEAEASRQSFVARYALDATDGASPVPLNCAYELIERSLARPTSAKSGATSDIARANAVLLLGAAVDGHAATHALADAALPSVPAAAGSRCGAVRLPDALTQASMLMADARHAPSIASRNEAMRSLLRSAGWQWAAWMVAGFALLQLARQSISPAVGVAVTLATWGIVAWLGRVPWPLSGERSFEPGREVAWGIALPPPFVQAMLVVAAVLLLASPWLRRWLRAGPQTMASRVGYPGMVVLTGIGFLLLLDLSANGHYGNRYLALYHHGHLWLGMLVFSVLVFLRQPIGRMLGWCLAVVDGVGSAIGTHVRWGWAASVFILLLLSIVGVVGLLLTNMRQITSEVGRVWLIVGAAWFFFLRGAPLAERMALSGSPVRSLLRYVGPLLFVVLVLIGAMAVTHDMGPLLIAGYGAGAFVAASVAMWCHQRYRATHAAFAIAVVLFVLWILGTTLALFELGAIDDVTAGRLENLAAPLASASDQLALVSWFQSASPPTGFGLGKVPWCGYASVKSCSGVPAQIQSDYTFTALVGEGGSTFAWMVTLGCALWLHRLIRHHGRVTRGEPRFVMRQGRVVSDDQALLSWMGVTWVVLALCQLGVTVAGNLAVIPLTGVTFPFVSFGMTSLLVNMALLALCLNINVPGQAHG